MPWLPIHSGESRGGTFDVRRGVPVLPLGFRRGEKKGKKAKTLIPETPKDLEPPTPASGKKKKTKESALGNLTHY
jgi:hypothetical protein